MYSVHTFSRTISLHIPFLLCALINWIDWIIWLDSTMSHFYWNLLWWFAFLCFVHFIIIKSDYFQKRKLGRIFHNNGNMFSRQKFGKKKKHSRQIFTWRGVLFIQFFLFLQFVWFQPFIHLIKIYFGPIYNYYIFFVLNTLECAVNTPGVGGEHSGVKSVDLVKFGVWPYKVSFRES